MQAPKTAPPFHLIWRHFVVALVVLPVALAAGAWLAPELVENVRSTAVLALMHALALGFIVMTVMGALVQMVPVVLGTPLPSTRLIAAAHALTLGGAAGLVVGFAGRLHTLLALGGGLATVGLGLYAVALGLTLGRVKRWELTSVSIAAALGLLLLGGSLGLAIIANQRLGFADALYGAMPVHVHLLAGGLTVLTAAVSYKLLPMFTLAYGHPPRTGRWVVAALATGTGAWLAVLAMPALWPLAAGLQGLGVALYVWDALRLVKRRKKRKLDTGLVLAVAAVWLLPLVAAAGLAGQAGAYGVLLFAGWISWTLIGYLYKIIPFIVWYHRFGKQPGPGPRPLAGDLVDARLAAAAGLGMGLGVPAAAGGLAFGVAALVSAGLALAAVGAAIAAFDLLSSPYRQGATPWKPATPTPSAKSSTPSSGSTSSTSA